MDTSLTMQDIRAHSYHVIRTGDRSRDRELVEALKYVDKLGALTGTDVSQWKVLEIFKSPQSPNGYPSASKSKINEMFFAELDRKKSAPPPEPSPLEPSVQEQLRYIFQKTEEREKAGCKEKYEVAKRDAEKHYIEAAKQMHRARRIYQTLLSFKPDVQVRINQISEILKDPFWTLSIDLGTSYLGFYTQPVVLHYKNSAQAVDVTVPMGSYFVELYMTPERDRDAICVRAHQKNISSSDLIHPHVNESGYVCFGNILPEYVTAVAKRNFPRIMELVKSVLTNYCDDEPYEHLYEFEIAHQQGAGYEPDEGETAPHQEDGILAEATIFPDPTMTWNSAVIPAVWGQSGTASGVHYSLSYGASSGTLESTTALTLEDIQRAATNSQLSGVVPGGETVEEATRRLRAQALETYLQAGPPTPPPAPEPGLTGIEPPDSEDDDTDENPDEGYY